MNPEIKKFKFKISLEIILKCVLYSLSIGLISSSLLMFLSKLALLKISPLVCILIGVTLWIVSFIVLFIINRPTEIKIAKRLDEDLNLNEKVKTMVYYKDSQQPMLVVQREHTTQLLKGYSSKQIPFKIAVLGLLITLISSGTLTASALIPQRVIEEKPPITSDTTSTSQTPSDTGGEKLSEEINQLEFSRIDEVIKNKLLEILRNVYAVYNDQTLSKEYKIEFIKKAIKDVDAIMKNDLSKNQLSIVFQFTALTNDIGLAIEHTNQKELDDAFTAIYLRLLFLTGTGLDKALSELSKTIEDDLALTVDKVRADDELYVYFKDFATTLGKYAKKTNKSKFKDEITDTIAQIKADTWAALSHQLDALEMCEEVESTLISLLNQLDPLPPTEPDDDSSDASTSATTPPPDSSQGNSDSSSSTSDSGSNSNNSDSSGEESENPGGIVFDKTDIIFDPNTNTNVEYSTIINEYYQQIITLIQDNHLEMSVEEVINTYFNYLYHPSNQEENEE